jgi:ribonuclease HI
MLNATLTFINHIWSSGTLPSAWQHAIITPIPKPNKDRSDPTSYRPISLTSCICKITETIINKRLRYHLEANNLITNDQSGFREGHSTIDQITRLQADIQRAFSKGLSVGAVFIDLTKAFDLVWHKGLFYKLKQYGITGNIYTFIQNFLHNRVIQVRVADTLSHSQNLELGVPQGSVISPTLFNIIFSELSNIIKKTNNQALKFADDAAITKSGSNPKHIEKSLQNGLDALSSWADEWGFRVNPTKTVCILFHRRHKKLLNLTLNGLPIPYQSIIKYLGVWFDSLLNFAYHIKNIQIGCQKSLNLLRSLLGTNFGASKRSLISIYTALIRSRLDYACHIIHHINTPNYPPQGKLALKTHKRIQNQLLILQRIQNKALRIITGAYSPTPIDVLHAESGLKPLEFRREHYILTYYTKTRTMGDKLPINNSINNILTLQATKPLHAHKTNESFITQAIHLNTLYNLDGLHTYKHTLPSFHPWLRTTPNISTQLLNTTSKDDPPARTKAVVMETIHNKWSQYTHIYTDGSKSPITQAAAYAVAIPSHKIIIQNRLPKHTSVYTSELRAIAVALTTCLTNHISNAVIFSDSLSSLQSIQTQHTRSRPDILDDIYIQLHKLKNLHYRVHLEWIPSHVGIAGNELADKLAKEALDFPIQETLSLSPLEITSIIKQTNTRRWQDLWHSRNHLKWRYTHDPTLVKPCDVTNWHHSRKGDKAITRLRVGVTRLKGDPILCKSPTQTHCNNCNQLEDISHVLLHCTQYTAERTILTNTLKSLNKTLTISNILFPPPTIQPKIHTALYNYLHTTDLITRI